jgi:hypothetical protein
MVAALRMSRAISEVTLVKHEDDPLLLTLGRLGPIPW